MQPQVVYKKTWLNEFSTLHKCDKGCTPSYTDQKVSRQLVARSFATIFAKVQQYNREFREFLRSLHLNN